MTVTTLVTINASISGGQDTPLTTLALGPTTLTTALDNLKQSYTLAGGDNTITLPTGTQGVIVEPPSSNAVALEMRRTGGANGLQLNPALPFGPWYPVSGTTTMIINAGGAVTVNVRFL